MAERVAVLGVEGMTCSACSTSVEKTVGQLPGVKRVAVALLQNRAEVVFDPAVVQEPAILEAIDDAGFDATLISSTQASPPASSPEPSNLPPQKPPPGSSRGAAHSALDCETSVAARIRVGGMTCASCSVAVKSALGSIRGVQSVEVALATELAEVQFDPQVLSAQDVAQAVEDAGFDAQLLETTAQSGTACLAIPDMDREDHAAAVEAALRQLPGVKSATADALRQQVQVEFDPQVVGMRGLVRAVEGIEVWAEDVGAGEHSGRDSAKQCLVRGPLSDDPLATDEDEGVALRDLASNGQGSQEGGGAQRRRLRVCLDGADGRPKEDAKDDASKGWAQFVSCSAYAVPCFLLAAVFPRVPLLGSFLALRILNLSIASLLKCALSTKVQFFHARRFYSAAWRSLRQGSANMDVLVALGTSSSYFFSLGTLLLELLDWQYRGRDFFETSAMLLMFILLGKFLEAMAKGRTSDAIKKLLQLAPPQALLVTMSDGKAISVEEIDSRLLQYGDVLKVLPGSKVPADGCVLSGSSHVDESMLTGESSPVAKTEGCPVLGGTLNTTGTLLVRVLRVGPDTTLSQIVGLVERAQLSKAPVQKFADTVASIFVPVVVLLSLITWLCWFTAGRLGCVPDEWVPEGADKELVLPLLFAIAVLVIACPCALGLATPTAVMVATGVGATQGILIKGGEPLETAHKVQCIAFDKTGTLTKGTAAVVAVKTWGQDVTQADLLGMAAAAETNSEHPLGKAIVEYARHYFVFSGQTPGADAREAPGPGEKGKDSLEWMRPVEDFEVLPGLGVQCTMEGAQFLAGNRLLMQRHSIPIPPQVESSLAEAEAQAQTGILVAHRGSVIGSIFIKDPLKPEAAVVVEALQKMGIRCVMLTGDNKRTAAAVASQVGISEVISEVLPAHKAAAIRSLQVAEGGTVVAMVGDGINDAPALVAADVGIAIGAGTDIAIEAANVVLMRSSLEDVVTAIDLSRTTFKRIRLNYIFAMGYNVFCIPIAAGLLYPFFHLRLPPWVAGAMMALSSISVVCSSLLLRWYKRPRISDLLFVDVKK